MSRSKKTVCNYSNCCNRAVVIIGRCNYCERDFCLKHRIPEAHTCPSMGLCNQRAFDRNAVNLMAGKCVSVKM
jgi:predicted nucleic acid binding AN1-type Zn finger protein